MKIGFVSGCFDWMSPGHVRLFRAARTHCDVLHVLMADDQTVHHYKGAGRPLLKYEERVEILETCHYVDTIHRLCKLPGNDNQFELIRKIKPDSYFEGADATDQNIQTYLDKLNIKRIILNTEPIHVSDILRRYLHQYALDADKAHQELIKIAGL